MTRTDARDVITSYGYDGLNRLKQISYNVGATGVPATAALSGDGVPELTYGTSTTANNVGRLQKMSDGLGSETYSYDVIGRTTQASKLVGTHTFNTGYGYNLIERSTLQRMRVVVVCRKCERNSTLISATD